MLAMLESCVTRFGGTYAMEDTDSMAIVATEHGGAVACPGGPLKMRRRPDAVNALTWAQVREISKGFEALNPYDRRAVPGSFLKIEDDNFDPATGKQREIWCVAISAKRYALFLKNRSNLPELLRKGPNGNSKDNHWSEHGLGHLLNPTDYTSQDRTWIAQFWHSIIGDCLKVKTTKIGFDLLPAIGRVTITSPAILIPLAELNRGKKYRDQIKPFNFLLTCHISPLGHPLAVDPAKFHLIAPFESNSKKWLQLKWIDQYSGKRYKITTERNISSRTTARVQTYGDVLLEYAHHPESKCADEHGNVCDRQTVGLLFRRHVQIGEIVAIGKESRKLEEVDAGLIHSAETVYTIYPDGARDTWEKFIRLQLKRIPLSWLTKRTGLSRRMVVKARLGQVRPHPRNRMLLANAVNEFFAPRPSRRARSFGKQS